MFIGVDGYNKGWVSVELNTRRYVRARCFDTFAKLMQAYSDARYIGVDMPIGLTDDGTRGAERAARAFIEGQASSIFNAPARALLKAQTYAEASAISQRVAGKGLSRQSYALLDKIRQVDAFVGDARVYEVHPEVCFRILNGGERVAGGKKSWGGQRARHALLIAAGVELPASLGEADLVPVDDVLDAAAAAWSARRIARGKARCFPPDEDPELRFDAGGRRIGIWA